MLNTIDKVGKYKDYAPLFLRLIFLLYFITAINVKVFTPIVIENFSEQLTNLNFPVPLFFAYLGTWSVFICYILLVIGWKVRLAAIPIIIYFAVAILTYHLPEGHSIGKTMPATALLVLGCFFFLNGAGKPSVDEGL